MPIPNYLRRAAAGVLITGLIFLLMPPALRLIDPTAAGFNVDVLNALGLAAILATGGLHMALYAYEKFLPRFQKYQAESLEGEAKLFENLTDALADPLYQEANIYPARLNQLIERRKVAQFIFLIRCVRLSFCLLSLAYLLHLATQMITLAMTAVPGSVPAL
ncbi:hypothetical protein [Hymenobacter sp.]|uniref:hypothetical protein n=1 Tax=Hymenobacter sp. TaxID=1898978 RepID=UPI00286A73F8|nr:hypothetical protein [Hymenobacter sp.]